MSFVKTKMLTISILRDTNIGGINVRLIGLTQKMQLKRWDAFTPLKVMKERNREQIDKIANR